MAPPYTFDGGDADWYRAFDIPPLRSSPSPVVVSGEDNLLIPVVPLLGSRTLISNNLEGSSHGPLLTADSSSSAMILRHEENYLLPMLSAPAPPTGGDPFCFDRLPPLPAAADGATAGLDNTLLMQPFSDIDLDAFGTTDENKPAPIADNNMMMIVPADDSHYGAGQDDAASVGGDGDQKTMGTAGCYSSVASVGFDMAVVRHGEHHHHHEEMPVAALPPLPPSMPLPHQVQVRRIGDRSAQPSGKTRLDHIGFDEIRKYFYMPITKAAREMNVGLTVLKKRCRELGVARWPHRKMKSLRALILNVQEMGKGMSPAAVQRELAALETYCALMEEDPSIELTERTKKLRQACFKESYKRRRAASVNGVIDHIYNFGQDHQLTLQEASSSTPERSPQSSHFFSY